MYIRLIEWVYMEWIGMDGMDLKAFRSVWGTLHLYQTMKLKPPKLYVMHENINIYGHDVRA